MTIVIIIFAAAFGFLLGRMFNAPVVDETDLELERLNYETDTDEDKEVEIKELLGLHPGPCIPDEWFGPTEMTVEIPSDEPPEQSMEEENVVLHAPVYFDCPLSHELQDHIYKEYVKQGFNYYPEEFMGLIISIIQWESGFNADNSNGKCHGLMSVSTLTDKTMEAWNVVDLMDPYDNITAGIHCFRNAREWAEKYIMSDPSEDIAVTERALLAYNLGRDGASKFLTCNKTYDSEYVYNVMCTFKKYMRDSGIWI